MGFGDLWFALREASRQEAIVRGFQRRLKDARLERPLWLKSPGRIKAGPGLYVARNVLLHGGGMPWSQGKGSITLGARVSIGEGCVLYGAGGIVIGDHVDMGPGCKLFSSRDHYGIEHARGEGTVHCFGPIRVGDHAILFSDVTIGPGITVGEGAVVGAKSLVLGDVPPWTVVGGVPARVLKKRGRDEEGDRLGLQA
ncbi:MAG TPA: acyltransferase [Candidatus Thermoplasmatota archaeon]|nr:acyltransferase [Candidatus Thermoplasmatota archaeon]